ncbi:MAG: gamma-glutamylcyclotransferase [Myxococcaceae bacterium]
MDSHYDQVMKARAQTQNAAPRRYFAYSTILDRAAFEEWRSQHAYEFFNLPEGEVAEALDVELVYDFQSRWWGGRVAGLADKKGSSVFGRLFEIAGVDWPVIQHKEGVVTGMCVEREVKLRVGSKELTATAFTTNPVRATLEGPISPRFIDALARGAEAAGLPKDYVAQLRSPQQ